jgi:hypothetical protein
VGQVLKSKGKCIRWLSLLEQILSRAREEGSEQLGRWHRRAMSIGAVVVWWEGTGWRAGEVQYMAEEQRWEDLVEVAPWVAVEQWRTARYKEGRGRSGPTPGGSDLVIEGNEWRAVAVLGGGGK